MPISKLNKNKYEVGTVYKDPDDGSIWKVISIKESHYTSIQLQNAFPVKCLDPGDTRDLWEIGDIQTDNVSKRYIILPEYKAIKQFNKDLKELLK